MTPGGMRAACERAVLLALLLFAVLPEALRRTAPFGLPAPRGAPPPAAEGMAAWFLQKQAEFHRALTLALREAANDRGGVLMLMSLAFAYGVVHAIGPGHGKAVISGYIVANESALKRGIALAFGAAAVQALIALGVVLVIAKIVGGTARDVDRSVVVIETLGFSLILAMGLWIVWRKGRALLGLTPAEAACTHDHGPSPAVFAKGAVRISRSRPSARASDPAPVRSSCWSSRCHSGFTCSARHRSSRWRLAPPSAQASSRCSR